METIKNVLRGLISRPPTQPFFLKLLKLCHAALNYGGGQAVEDSGEIDAMRFLRGSENSSWVVFDVGANNGQYLAQLLKIFPNGIKAYSFEPQAECFMRLTNRFGHDTRVHLENKALGSSVSSAVLSKKADGDLEASLCSLTSGNSDQEIVEVDTLDRFCESKNIQHIDFLKIDTEGWDFNVLQGADTLLKQARIRAIQFEFGDVTLGSPYHFRDFWNLLADEYRIYRLLRHGMVEITGYSPDLEIYKIANFLCVIKKTPQQS